MPGEQLAQDILNANLLNVLQLVVAMFVLAIVVLVLAILAMMYYNSQAVSKMSATQQNMSTANSQMVAADAKKTEVMQGSLDEMKLFRQDFAVSNSAIQRSFEDHEAKSDQRVKAITEHVTTESRLMQDVMKTTMSDLLGQAVGTIKGNTIEAVRPALTVIDELRQLSDTISLRQDTAVERLNQMQQLQIAALKEQNDAHIRVINARLAQAQKDLIQALQESEQETTRHENIEPQGMDGDRPDTLPDTGKLIDASGLSTGHNGAAATDSANPLSGAI